MPWPPCLAVTSCQILLARGGGGAQQGRPGVSRLLGERSGPGGTGEAHHGQGVGDSILLYPLMLDGAGRCAASAARPRSSAARPRDMAEHVPSDQSFTGQLLDPRISPTIPLILQPSPPRSHARRRRGCRPAAPKRPRPWRSACCCYWPAAPLVRRGAGRCQLAAWSRRDVGARLPPVAASCGAAPAALGTARRIRLRARSPGACPCGQPQQAGRALGCNRAGPQPPPTGPWRAVATGHNRLGGAE